MPAKGIVLIDDVLLLKNALLIDDVVLTEGVVLLKNMVLAEDVVLVVGGVLKGTAAEVPVPLTLPSGVVEADGEELGLAVFDGDGLTRIVLVAFAPNSPFPHRKKTREPDWARDSSEF